MKTFLAIIVIALSLGGCDGIRQSNDNEPSATYRPLPKTANLPGIDYAFAPMALTDKKGDDYWQFEKWLQYVHQEAPRHHLKLEWGEPTQEKFFYLYCWQSNNHSVLHAIQLAKETWRPVGEISQVSNRNTPLDDRFRRAKAAALKQFGEPVKGTNVDVRCKYDGGPSSIYVIALNHNQSDVSEIYLVIVDDDLRQRNKPPVQVAHIDTED